MLEIFLRESKVKKKIVQQVTMSLMYLGANNTAKSPHSIVRRVTLSCTLQLKGDSHCVPLHLDRFFGPAQSYHSSTAHTERVTAILRYFTTSCCLAGIKNNLENSDISIALVLHRVCMTTHLFQIGCAWPPSVA